MLERKQTLFLRVLIIHKMRVLLLYRFRYVQVHCNDISGQFF